MSAHPSRLTRLDPHPDLVAQWEELSRAITSLIIDEGSYEQGRALLARLRALRGRLDTWAETPP